MFAGYAEGAVASHDVPITGATGTGAAFPESRGLAGQQPESWLEKSGSRDWMVHGVHHRHQAQQQEPRRLERMTHAVEHAGRWAPGAPGPRHPSSEPMQRIDAGQASTPSSMHPAPMERPWGADRARMPSASHAAGPQPSSYRPGAQQPSASTSPPGARTLHGEEARAARAAHLTDGHTAWPDGAAAAEADEWPNPAAPVSHVDADARRAYAGPSRPGDHTEGSRYASQAPSTGQPWTDWSQPPPRRTQPARTVIRTYPVHRVPRQMARMEMYEVPAYVEVCEYAAPRLRPARHYARMPHQMPHPYRPAMAAPADWYDYAAEPEACHCPACQSLMAEYGQDVDEYSVSGTYEPMSTDMEYCVQPRIRYSSRPAPTRMVWADPPPRAAAYLRGEYPEIHSSTADFSDRGWVDVHDSPHTPGMVHETDEYAPGMQAGRPWGPQYTKMNPHRHSGPGSAHTDRAAPAPDRSTHVHSHESGQSSYLARPHWHSRAAHGRAAVVEVHEGYGGSAAPAEPTRPWAVHPADAPVTGMWEGTARPVTHAAGAPQLSRHASMGSLQGRSEDGTPKMSHWPSQYDPAAQHPVESREQRPGHHAGQGPTRGDQGLQHQQSQLSDDDAEEQQGYHEEPAAHNPYVSHAHDAALRQGNQQPEAGPHTASQPLPWQERHTSQSQQAPEHRSHQAPHHHTPAPAQAAAHAMPHGSARAPRDQLLQYSSPEEEAVTLQQAGFTPNTVQPGSQPGILPANQLTRGAHSLPAASGEDGRWASTPAGMPAVGEPAQLNTVPSHSVRAASSGRIGNSAPHGQVRPDSACRVPAAGRQSNPGHQGQRVEAVASQLAVLSQGASFVPAQPSNGLPGTQSRAPETPGQAVPPHASLNSPVPPAKLRTSASGAVSGSQQQSGADVTRALETLCKLGSTFQGLQGSIQTSVSGALAGSVVPSAAAGAGPVPSQLSAQLLESIITAPAPQPPETLQQIVASTKPTISQLVLAMYAGNAKAGQQDTQVIIPKKRGRPKGSKNKQPSLTKKRPKSTTDEAAVPASTATVNDTARGPHGNQAARAEAAVTSGPVADGHPATSVAVGNAPAAIAVTSPAATQLAPTHISPHDADTPVVAEFTNALAELFDPTDNSCEPHAPHAPVPPPQDTPAVVRAQPSASLMTTMPSQDHPAGSSQTLTASSPDDSCHPAQEPHTLHGLVVPRDILYTWAASETLQANAPGFLIRALGAGCWDALLGYNNPAPQSSSTEVEVWYECGRIESVTVKPGQDGIKPTYLLVARFGTSEEAVRNVQLEEVSNEVPFSSEVSHWLDHGGSISTEEAAHLRSRFARLTHQ